MKRKVLISVILVIILFLLNGCMMMSSNDYSSFWGTGEKKQEDQSNKTEQKDMVTISREEYEKLKRFSDLSNIYDIIDQYYYTDYSDEQVLDYACKGLLAGLDDPYSFYYTPEEYKKMWEDDEGSYAGIGILISANYKTTLCTISRVFKGSPAEASGVQRGDILYKVGEDLIVTAENLDEAVKIMRGEPGTSVDITFIRNGEEITFSINREIINVNQIESKMLQEKIGYIALYQFAGQCDKEFETALEELIGHGAEGIIIDLRDNGGGWVEQARYIADLFMDEGELCYLVLKDGTEEHNYYLTSKGKKDVAIVVLVNEMSASSSEILTGALRDCANATIVGTTTFGKGIVQDVISVGNRGAGFQLTVAQYFTPNGKAVHEVGIIPDVVIERPEGDTGMYEFADTENDIQLKKALDVMSEKIR